MGIRRVAHPTLQAEASCFRYDPYSTTRVIVAVKAAPSCASAVAAADAAFAAPARMLATPEVASAAATTPLLHPGLIGKVAFFPFPEEAFPVRPAPAPKQELSRVFFGQLPYDVTDMELAWVVDTLARGTATFFNERIVKKCPRDSTKKMPTGCVHTYCEPHRVEALIEAVDKRLMFDDSGIWYAEDAAQKAALDEYCLMLKENPAMRPADRPYQPVVVQPATSTYIPNLHSNPRRRSPAGTPPPAYNFGMM